MIQPGIPHEQLQLKLPHSPSEIRNMRWRDARNLPADELANAIGPLFQHSNLGMSSVLLGFKPPFQDSNLGISSVLLGFKPPFQDSNLGMSSALLGFKSPFQDSNLGMSSVLLGVITPPSDIFNPLTIHRESLLSAKSEEEEEEGYDSPIGPIGRRERYNQAKRILAEKWGMICWACGFHAPRLEYLELDHIRPKSECDDNELDNFALLCGPCNKLKSNDKTLTGVRKANKRWGYILSTEPIEQVIKLREIHAWAVQYKLNNP